MTSPHPSYFLQDPSPHDHQHTTLGITFPQYEFVGTIFKQEQPSILAYCSLGFPQKLLLTNIMLIPCGGISWSELRSPFLSTALFISNACSNSTRSPLVSPKFFLPMLQLRTSEFHLCDNLLTWILYRMI